MSARKTRPALGTLIQPGMSERDIAAALGVSRRWIWQAKLVAAIPKDEFEALIEKGRADMSIPTITELCDVARGRATRRNLATVCPHCGSKLKAVQR